MQGMTDSPRQAIQNKQRPSKKRVRELISFYEEAAVQRSAKRRKLVERSLTIASPSASGAAAKKVSQRRPAGGIVPTQASIVINNMKARTGRIKSATVEEPFIQFLLANPPDLSDPFVSSFIDTFTFDSPPTSSKKTFLEELKSPAQALTLAQLFSPSTVALPPPLLLSPVVEGKESKNAPLDFFANMPLATPAPAIFALPSPVAQASLPPPIHLLPVASPSQVATQSVLTLADVIMAEAEDSAEPEAVLCPPPPSPPGFANAQLPPVDHHSIPAPIVLPINLADAFQTPTQDRKKKKKRATAPTPRSGRKQSMAPTPSATASTSQVETGAINKDSHRIFAANEIIMTERNFVSNMMATIKNYLLPLRRVLEEKDIQMIFANLPGLVKFNEMLLAQLEQRKKHWNDETVLGDIFVNLAPFLSMYSDYCTNYENASNYVVKLKQSNQAAAQIIERGQNLSAGLDLVDFLIMPVQRIPRYRLLLESLLKFTPAGHQDFKLLTQAIELVSSKAIEINQKMALASQQKKVMEVASQFEALPLEEDLVQPYRHFVAEFAFAWVSLVNTEGKKAQFGFRPVTMFLFNDLVILAEKTEADKADNAMTCIGVHPIYCAFLKKLDDTWDLAGLPTPPFQFVTPKQTYSLVPPSNEVKNKFKVDFEGNRDKLLAAQPALKTKRFAIKIVSNGVAQEWMAVEPAPTFAARTSQENLAVQTAEFTKAALEELLRDNQDFFQARPATPIKTPKKSRLHNLKDDLVAKFTSPLKSSSSSRSRIVPGTPVAVVPPSPMTPKPSAGTSSPRKLSIMPLELPDKENYEDSIAVNGSHSIGGLNLSQADVLKTTIKHLEDKSLELKLRSPKVSTPRLGVSTPNLNISAATDASKTPSTVGKTGSAKKTKRRTQKHTRAASAFTLTSVADN